MTDRIAHHVRIDHRPEDEGGGLFVEGVRVPFYVADDIEALSFEQGVIGGVSMVLYADVIEVVSRWGEVSHFRSRLADQADLEWAAREGRRIVHDGMADILHALWNSTATRAQALQVLGLDEADVEALRSETTHSEERQNGDTAP